MKGDVDVTTVGTVESLWRYPFRLRVHEGAGSAPSLDGIEANGMKRLAATRRGGILLPNDSDVSQEKGRQP